MGNIYSDLGETQERTSLGAEGPPPAETGGSLNPTESSTPADATAGRTEHAATVRSSTEQAGEKPESSHQRDFHPLFLKEFSPYLSLLEDKPVQEATLAAPTEDVEVARETCTEAVQPEEFIDLSQTSNKPEVSAVADHEEDAPQQPQPHQQTHESFEILTWVKKVAGDHFALKETEVGELAKFMTQLRPGKVTKTELHKPIESTGPVTRNQKMRKGKAVSRKTLSKRGKNPKKFVIDVTDDEEKTTRMEGRIQPVEARVHALEQRLVILEEAKDKIHAFLMRIRGHVLKMNSDQ